MGQEYFEFGLYMYMYMYQCFSVGLIAMYFICIYLLVQYMYVGDISNYSLNDTLQRPIAERVIIHGIHINESSTHPTGLLLLH